MTFLPFVPDPKELIKASIERAKKRARQTFGYNKQSTKKKRELIRVEALASSLADRLEQIVKDSANFDRIPPFYKDLISAKVDIPKIKRSLAVIDWLSNKIRELDRTYRRKMRKSSDIGEITALRKQFEARIEDLLLDNRDAFDTLKEASKELEDLPKIKEMPTIIIAGYPNVGKSSILKALTGSEVEVRSYPFTTKQILVGYARKGYNQIQLVDTPGLLDRPIEKMNKIEKQALAALKHLSKKVLFVLDPSETCGYPLEKQLELLESLKKMGLDVKVVANKADLESKSLVDVDMVISALNPEDIEKLKDFLFAWLCNS